MRRSRTPVPEVTESLNEAVEAGYLTADQIDVLVARLGKDGLTGFADVALNVLKKRVLLSAAVWTPDTRAAEPVDDNMVLLLPDMALIKRRVDGYINELLDELTAKIGKGGIGEISVQKIRKELPGALGVWFPVPEDTSRLEASVPVIVDALERAVAGSLAAILKLLKIPGHPLEAWDYSHYAPATFAGPARPSMSVLLQAQSVYHAARVGIQLGVGPVTAALVPGLTTAAVIGGVPGRGDTGYTGAYLAALDWLRGLGMAGVSFGVLVDLAHLFALAATGNAQPGVMTGDWSVIEAMAARAGIDTSGRGPAESFTDFFTRTKTSTPFTVSPLGEGEILIYPVDAPPNPAITPTPARQLAQLSEPPRVAYGTELVLHGGTDTARRAYLYGYDAVGRARVLWEDGETLELLAPATPVQVSSPDGRLSFTMTTSSPDSMDVVMQTRQMPSAGPLAAFEWQRAGYKVPALLQAFPALGTAALQLAALLDRKVADHPDLTIGQYVNLITDAGFSCFIVGGAVRDVLLGAIPNDIDLASTMPAPDTYQAIVTDPRGLGKKGGRGGQLEVRKNLPFGTVQVEPAKVTGLDIISTHDLPHGSSLSVDVDAYARDFTINAIYYEPGTGTVIDPTGKGLADLAARQLRFILDPGKVLSGDLVLIGRWIKFIAKNFKPAEDDANLVLNALRAHLTGKVDDLARARFIDRSGLSPTVLVTQATQINGELGNMVKALVFPGQ